ncbi:MAG: hypothetical protein ACJ79K_17270 [Gemmatimonadaceae bacterium]
MNQRLCCVVLLSILTRASVLAQGSPAPTKVVDSHGVWWILDDQGALRTLDGRRISVQRLGGLVRDIAQTPSGDLLALIQRRGSSRAQLMKRVASGEWAEYAKLKLAAADTLIGLVASDSDAIALSGHAYYLVRSGRQPHRYAIRGPPVAGGLQPAVARTLLGQLYVGENAGEFGGRLSRIDLATGASERIEQRGAAGGCAGLLNSACDPITAVIPDPANARCAIVSIGLLHMGMELGRIVRVCGSRVTLVAELPCPDQRQSDPPCSLGVFGLAAATDGFWASTEAGLYHFRGSVIDQQLPTPAMQRHSTLSYSDAIPGLLVLSTDINWRASVSGPTPLIAARASKK